MSSREDNQKFAEEAKRQIKADQVKADRQAAEAARKAQERK